jgi:hypothetical protein
MIGIKINNEFLELPIGTTTQVDRNTPLALGDEIIGEYSFPFIFKSSPHNMRLCGFINELGVIKNDSKIRIPAEYYENNFFAYKGILVAEYVQTNLNRPEEGEISAYFLTGISSFYQKAKNVLLKDINLGGDRISPALSFINTATATWTKTSEQTDYVFAPIYNPGFLRMDVSKYTNDEDVPEDVQSNFMNKIEYYGNTVSLAYLPNKSTLVPFIYLVYLIRQVFAAFNFTVTGEILEDSDFKKIFIDNYQAIDWFTLDLTAMVKFNLKSHVPVDWNVARFLLELAKRYAFSYQFDPNNSTCKIVQLNTLPIKQARRDFTYALAANVKLSFVSESKVYALTQEFDERDEAISAPDFTGLTRGLDVQSYLELPPAGGDYEKHYVLVRNTNQWYACKYEDGIDPVFVWALLGDNIYDYEPEKKTDAIPTEITTVSQILYTDWRPNSKALFPYVNRPGNAGIATSEFIINLPEIVPGYSLSPPSITGYIGFGMRLLYFHGMRPDQPREAGGISVNYPFASSHIYDMNGTKIGNYSAAYNGYDNNGEVGLVAMFWSNWLRLLSSQENGSFTLLLRLHEYLQLQWEDIILLRSVAYLVTRIQVNSPFSVDSQDCSKVQCEALRIIT